jgi:hypothetical protein
MTHIAHAYDQALDPWLGRCTLVAGSRRTYRPGGLDFASQPGCLALQCSSNRGGVDAKGPSDRLDGFARVVATGGVMDVGLGHLGLVDAPRYAASFKVAGDGSSMNPELCGEVDERSASSIGGDEPVDLGLVEAALNETPNRFQRSRLLTSTGCARAAGSDSGVRV